MEPVDIDKCPVVTHSAAHGAATSSGKTAILLVAAAGVAGVTGGIVGFQIGRNTASGTNSGIGSVVETCHGASLQADSIERPIVGTQCAASLPATYDHPITRTNNHSPQRTRNVPTHTGNMPSPVKTLHATSLQNPDTSPVIIITKIPVHQTVVIRDTTTISDTVFLMKNE